MSMTFNGANGINFTDGTSQNTAASGFGFKNRIINGAMLIDQRYSGSTVTNPNGYNSLDRWVVSNYISTTTVVRSTNAPDGFTRSLYVTTGTSTNPDVAWTYYVSQAIEGYNFADFMYGTSTAKSMAISFWVRSSETGTFAVALRNSGSTRSYVTTYTVNASNTWEYKTIIVAGDITGTWVGATNGLGVEVIFDIGSGSNYSTATTNAWQSGNYFRTSGTKSLNTVTGSTFAITGVQVEKGSVATAFDYRDYGREDILCKRYYEPFGNGWTVRGESTNSSCVMFGQFKVEKRAQPSIAVTTSNVRMYEWGVADRDASTVSIITAASMYSWGGHIKLSGWGTIGTGTIYGMGYNTTTTNGHPFAAAAEL